MSGALLEPRSKRPERAAAPPTWTRSTVHDFFRKTNWDNRPIEPPRVHKLSPYELTVNQFFQSVDWQWVAPARSTAGASQVGIETTLPGPDSLDPDGFDLDGSGLHEIAEIDEGLTLDGLTDLF